MRLSEFKDEKGIEVVAKLLAPIGRIAKNAKNADTKNKSVAEIASTMLMNNASDVKEMLAIINDTDPKKYHCDAATVLVDTFNMISDPGFQALFGLQGQTRTSSGSASENTEVQKA